MKLDLFHALWLYIEIAVRRGLVVQQNLFSSFSVAFFKIKVITFPWIGYGRFRKWPNVEVFYSVKPLLFQNMVMF